MERKKQQTFHQPLQDERKHHVEHSVDNLKSEHTDYSMKEAPMVLLHFKLHLVSDSAGRGKEQVVESYSDISIKWLAVVHQNARPRPHHSCRFAGYFSG